jgi:hypothetical protein
LVSPITNPGDWRNPRRPPISLLAGEMSGRTEGGATGADGVGVRDAASSRRSNRLSLPPTACPLAARSGKQAVSTIDTTELLA